MAAREQCRVHLDQVFNSLAELPVCEHVVHTHINARDLDVAMLVQCQILQLDGRDRPSISPDRCVARVVLVRTPNTDSWQADAMRKLTFGMNMSLDGYIAAPGNDLGWSLPSGELFQWWSDRVGATGLALYGRKLWETM